MTGSSGHLFDNKYRRAFQGSCEGALHHWRLIAALLVVAVTALSTWEFIFGETGWKKTRHLQQETNRLLAENTTLTRRVQDLKEQERLLSSDDFVLEKMVRENLRLAKPGEILYIFEENPANQARTEPVEVTVAKRPPKKEEGKGR